MAENNSGETVWKNIAVFLAGLLLSGAGWLASSTRDSISRTEVDQKIDKVYLRQDQQYAAVNAHLENIDRTQVESGKEIARIGEHLGVPRKPASN